MVKLDKTIGFVPLDVPKDEIDQYRNYTTKLLTDINYHGDIPAKVGQIIRDALKGWDHAPVEFKERVKKKIGYNRVNKYEAGLPDEHSQLFTKMPVKGDGRHKPDTPTKIYQKETLKVLEEVDPLELISPAFLSSEEMVFVNKRKKLYNKEFDFNESSDQILLQQILIDELIIRRINLAKLKGEEQSQSNIDKIMDRFRKNLEKLGVLRVQRLELNIDIEGNVGQLSIELDKKLDRIRKLRDKTLRETLLNKLKDRLVYSNKTEILQMIEEIEYQKVHDLEYPANELPFDEEEDED